MNDPFPTAPPSAGLSRRNMMFGAAMLATAGLAFARTPRDHYDLLGKAKLEGLIPPRIGPWEFEVRSGLVLPPADQLRDQLYAQILTRVYASRGAPPIMLLIAQSPGQDGMIQVHRPEVCYPAGGFRLSEASVDPVVLPGGRRLPTRRFTAQSDVRTEHLLYWTRVGEQLPTSWADQRIAVMRENVRGVIPDAVLVRVSTLGVDRTAAMPVLETFARALLGAVPPRTRQVLIGADLARA